MRRWFTKLILALGIAIAAPESANAATWYVSPSGSDVATNGTTTPFATAAKAIDTCATGDVIKFLASDTTHAAITMGQYTGTTSITFLGDSAAPNKVKVASVNFTAKHGGVDHSGCVFNGLRVVGNFAVESNPVPSQYGLLENTHVRNCVIVGNTSALEANLLAFSNRFGTDSASAIVNVSVSRPGRPASVFVDNVFKVRSTNTASDYFFSLRGTDGARYEDCVLLRNKFTVTQTVAVSKTTMLQFLHDLASTDNKWTFNDSTGVSSGGQGFLMRDDIQGLRSLRDTILINRVRSGSSSMFAQLIGSGAGAAGQNNVWKFLYLKSDLPISSSTYGAFYWWNLGPGDSLYYSTAICSTGVSNSSVRINHASGRCYVGHNTFANFGGGGALRIDPSNDPGECGSWVGPLVLLDNIIYTKSTSTISTGFAAKFRWKNHYSIYSDYNLYAHYGGSGTRAINGGTCSQTTGFLSSIGSASSRCASMGRDCNSVYGSPTFIDSSYANFNHALKADSTSAAFRTGSGGGDIGSLPLYTADVTPPDTISTLDVTATSPSTITVGWTSVGDDASSGTAAAYDLRYSLATITNANFASATSVGGIAAPAVAGTATEKVVTGLSAATRYYFAIRTRDEQWNWSAISNVVNAATTTFGGTTGTGDE